MKILSANDLDMLSLRRDHEMIHFFGLGFIQLKLNQSMRLHFYTDELPAFVEHPHNHRYNFTSRVLSGIFENTRWREDKAGEKYLTEKESCKKGSPSAKSEARIITLSPEKTEIYGPGDCYHMSHETLHTVRGREAITFLKRGPIAKEEADVTRPLGADSICPFSREIPEETLWKIVARMINEAQREA